MKIINKIHWGGILLVAGTCIGAGMIGVPVKTAAAGFYPTLLAFFGFWLITTLCGLLFVEIALSFKADLNFISMVKTTLGDFHKNFTWLIYLLFMYSILAGYTLGGANMIQQWIQPIISINIYTSRLVFLVPFILIIYLGAKWVDFVNRFLTIGLIGSFILLCLFTLMNKSGATNSHKLLLFGNFRSILFALPILSATFSYHIIIPSLKTYLDSKIRPLKQAIWLGGFIPLLIYVVWQLSVCLLIPASGKDGLISMLMSNQNPSESIINYIYSHNNHPAILLCISIFLFCALTSSLIGAGWALVDFLADGLKITKNHMGKIKLNLLSFVPPVIYTIIFPQGFFKAIGFAGAFSAILTIIYPALIILKLRSPNFKSNVTIENKYQAPINKLGIIGILIFGLLIVVLELLNNIHL